MSEEKSPINNTNKIEDSYEWDRDDEDEQD